jgi:hypothetical protein
MGRIIQPHVPAHDGMGAPNAHLQMSGPLASGADGLQIASRGLEGSEMILPPGPSLSKRP